MQVILVLIPHDELIVKHLTTPSQTSLVIAALRQWSPTWVNAVGSLLRVTPAEPREWLYPALCSRRSSGKEVPVTADLCMQSHSPPSLRTSKRKCSGGQPCDSCTRRLRKDIVCRYDHASELKMAARIDLKRTKSFERQSVLSRSQRRASEQGKNSDETFTPARDRSTSRPQSFAEAWGGQDRRTEAIPLQTLRLLTQKDLEQEPLSETGPVFHCEDAATRFLTGDKPLAKSSYNLRSAKQNSSSPRALCNRIRPLQEDGRWRMTIRSSSEASPLLEAARREQKANAGSADPRDALELRRTPSVDANRDGSPAYIGDGGVKAQPGVSIALSVKQGQYDDSDDFDEGYMEVSFVTSSTRHISAAEVLMSSYATRCVSPDVGQP